MRLNLELPPLKLEQSHLPEPFQSYLRRPWCLVYLKNRRDVWWSCAGCLLRENLRTHPNGASALPETMKLSGRWTLLFGDIVGCFSVRFLFGGFLKQCKIPSYSTGINEKWLIKEKRCRRIKKRKSIVGCFSARFLLGGFLKQCKIPSSITGIIEKWHKEKRCRCKKKQSIVAKEIKQEILQFFFYLLLLLFFFFELWFLEAEWRIQSKTKWHKS